MNKAVCALFSDTAVTAIYCRNTWFLLRPSHLLLWVSFFWFSSVLLGKCRGSTAMKPGLLPYSPSVFIQLHRHCAVWISHSTTGCTQQQMHCVFIGRMHTAADALYIPWQDSYSNRCTVYSLAGCTQQQMHCIFIGRMHTATDALYIHWQDAHSNRCTVYSLAGCTQQQMHCIFISRMHTATDALYIN